MQTQNIAIVGLNEMGTEFFKGMINLKEKGVNVVSVCERVFTEGTQLAQEKGIQNLSLENLVELGEVIDIIFDLSNNRNIRKELRKHLFSTNNQHTVIAPESVARLMYTMISEDALPGDTNLHSGY